MLHINEDVKSREAKVRRAAARLGWLVEKSRARNLHANDCGNYQVIEVSTNTVLWGANYDIGLAAVEDVVSEAAAKALRKP